MKTWKLWASASVLIVVALGGIGLWLTSHPGHERVADDLFACQNAIVMLRSAAAHVPMEHLTLSDNGQKVIRLAWTIDGTPERGFCRFERGSAIHWMEEVLLDAPGAERGRQKMLVRGDRLALLNAKTQLAMTERRR